MKIKPDEPNLDGGIGKHRHRWYIAGWRGNLISFQCRCKRTSTEPAEKGLWPTYCQARYERVMTPAERVLQRRANVQAPMHRVYRAFERAFKEKQTSQWTAPGRKQTYEGWRYSGYEFIHRVDAWSKRYPNDVRTVRVDDAVYSSSRLVLINHRASDRVHGTTVVIIPQNSGPACEFFLYPDHLKVLLATLRLTHAGNQALIAIENANERKLEAEWRRVVQLP